MPRRTKTCETCANWDREHRHETIDGKEIYAGCFVLFYSANSNDSCQFWERWKPKANH